LTSKLPSIISLITNYGPLWIHFKHQSNISKSIDFIWPSRPTYWFAARTSIQSRNTWFSMVTSTWS
jgi:hypothetical protein